MRIIFAKIFVIFSRFRKIENPELSVNHKKITLKSKFGNLGKLVPAWLKVWNAGP